MSNYYCTMDPPTGSEKRHADTEAVQGLKSNCTVAQPEP